MVTHKASLGGLDDPRESPGTHARVAEMLGRFLEEMDELELQVIHSRADVGSIIDEHIRSSSNLSAALPRTPEAPHSAQMETAATPSILWSGVTLPDTNAAGVQPPTSGRGRRSRPLWFANVVTAVVVLIVVGIVLAAMGAL
jgi:hypothetical protein